MRRLTCAFVVRIWHKQVFSWRGPIIIKPPKTSHDRNIGKLAKQQMLRFWWHLWIVGTWKTRNIIIKIGISLFATTWYIAVNFLEFSGVYNDMVCFILNPVMSSIATIPFTWALGSMRIQSNTPIIALKILLTPNFLMAQSTSNCSGYGNTKQTWAASWQNQQNGMCAQRRLRSGWASAQSHQSLCCALNG